MAEINPPADLIDLKARFLEAHDAHTALLATMPSGEQIVAALRAGTTAITSEQYDASEASLKRCTGLAMLIQRHEWWRTQPSRSDADRVLFEAAKGRLAERVPALAG